MDLLEALNTVNMIADTAAIEDSPEGINEHEAVATVDSFIAKLQSGRVSIDGYRLYRSNKI